MEIKRPSIEKIRLENLTFGYESSDPLLSNIDFDLPTDQVVWIKAASGSGRSSLLQLLAGLQVPQTGGIYLNEDNVTEMSFEEFLPYRLSIGYAFDYGGLINNRSMFENLTLPLLYHKVLPSKEAYQRVEYYIEIFKMQRYRDLRPAMVPGGVRKLVCLIRSFILHPQVLLLDDPSVGLGQDTIYKFVDTIHQLRKEGHLRHIYMSSFDEKFAHLFESNVIHIDGGCLHYEKVGQEKRIVGL
jgi:phospholipid/cholesterol/gamma-HCH transport system ATP-binding protein